MNDQISAPIQSALSQIKESGVYETSGFKYELSEPAFPEDQRSACESENLGLLGGVIAAEVKDALQNGEKVLMVGGNCVHSTGVVGGLQQILGADARIGVVWFDAHGDFNTPNTSLTGRLFGMPVAVLAGLACPDWRIASGILAPLPCERILLVDGRNLDLAEAQLIRAVGVPVAAVSADFPGEDLHSALLRLSSQCDHLYLHVDADVLDERFTPNHVTSEPDGPDVESVCRAVEQVFSTGKVCAFAVACLFGEGQESEILVNAGKEIIRRGLAAWRMHGPF